MNRKKYLFIIGLVAAVLVCVLLIGLIGGFWQGDNGAQNGEGSAASSGEASIGTDEGAGSEESSATQASGQSDPEKDVTEPSHAGSGVIGGSVEVEPGDIRIPLGDSSEDPDGGNSDSGDSGNAGGAISDPENTVDPGNVLDFDDFFRN